MFIRFNKATQKTEPIPISTVYHKRQEILHMGWTFSYRYSFQYCRHIINNHHTLGWWQGLWWEGKLDTWIMNKTTILRSLALALAMSSNGNDLLSYYLSAAAFDRDFSRILFAAVFFSLPPVVHSEEEIIMIIGFPWTIVTYCHVVVVPLRWSGGLLLLMFLKIHYSLFLLLQIKVPVYFLKFFIIIRCWHVGCKHSHTVSKPHIV